MTSEYIPLIVWMLLTWMSRCDSYHKIYHENAKSLVGHGTPLLVLILVGYISNLIT